ncbi:MAG: preprotein translocase subunit SecG [Treponema sp.]|jgi:preprotein translocase subunit SecG|nr:preprotein translocase subunit SecG [Treponema sp.]
MGIVRTILLVAFVIICVLLVLLVLIQHEDSNGMGGVFGGQTAAFGAHSASVVTKTTAVLTVMFFLSAFGIALLNKGSTRSSDLNKAAAEVNGSATGTSQSAAGSWLDD